MGEGGVRQVPIFKMGAVWNLTNNKRRDGGRDARPKVACIHDEAGVESDQQ